jgi:hypothetical protein
MVQLFFMGSDNPRCGVPLKYFSNHDYLILWPTVKDILGRTSSEAGRAAETRNHSL